ncbi:MAG TPA: hypothetical protein VGI98_05705 [Candidatus Limnocylindrales bacterium]
MFRKRLTRYGSVVTTAALAVMLLGVGGATAKTPAGWSMTVSPIVDQIGPGAVQGYNVHITNTGPSNIAKLYLSTLDVSKSKAGTPISPAYSSLTGCNTGADQGCAFGAFPVGRVVDLQLAYTAAAGDSPFKVEFDINTNGFVLGTNSSHGDSFRVSTSTTVNGSADFAGGFSLDGLSTFTTGAPSGSNNQQSSVTGPNLLAITVTEGGGSPDATDPCTTYTCIGQWDRVTVGNHDQGPVRLVLNITGVPHSTQASDINLYHTGEANNGIVSARCSSATPPSSEMPCITVTKLGTGHFQIVAWLLHNGGARGLF